MERRYERMPNGQMVSVPADISPAKLSEIRAKYTPKKSDTSSNPVDGINVPKTRQQTRVEARKAKINSGGTVGLAAKAISYLPEQLRKPAAILGLGIAQKVSPLGVLNTASGGNVIGGATFNFDDEAKGAIASLKGIPEAIRQRSFTPIAEEYRTEQQANDEIKKDFARDNPGAAAAAQALGGLAVPIGGTGQTLLKVSRAARTAGATRAANAVARVAARQRASGAIARGVTTGAGIGALNGAGNSESLADLPSDALEGGVLGGVLGGTLGATVRGGTAVARTIKDRRTLADGVTAVTSAKAYKRVGSLIDNIRDASGKPISPSEIVRRTRAANRTGADTRIADQSAGLRAEAAYLGRQTGIPNSNTLQDLAESRILARQGKFTGEVSKRASTKGADARALRDSIDGARKAKGDFDYREGGHIDTPITWTPEIDAFFKEAGPTTQAALRKAYDIMLDERRNPLELGLTDTGTFSAVPKFRTLDYLKRAYDEIIGGAVGSGNKPLASRISSELRELKGMLVEQNPEYAKILASQRDPFEKLQAIELGERIFKEMKTKPRELLREIKKLDPAKADDARVGIIDRLLNLDVTADPVAAVRGLMRNKAQRKILEFAFGGSKQLASFEKYVENEVKATLTDKFISSGRNSLTGTLNQAGFSQQEALQEVGAQAVKGYGFGGSVGLLANVVGGVKRVAGKVNPEVQNEIARILMSRGEDLEEGLRNAARFFAQRIARDRKAVATASRAVATPAGAFAGE